MMESTLLLDFDITGDFEIVFDYNDGLDDVVIKEIWLLDPKAMRSGVDVTAYVDQRRFYDMVRHTLKEIEAYEEGAYDDRP
jgi:hypothetical protein